jgi:hypothetical protein
MGRGSGERRKKRLNVARFFVFFLSMAKPERSTYGKAT